MPLQIPDQILFDVRLQARYIERGLLTREELQKRLEELPDSAPQLSTPDLERLTSAVERSAASSKG